MNKKARIVGIIISLIILTSSLVAWAVLPNKTSKQNELIDINIAIRDSKPTVVMFYAPWCSACKNYEPFYKSFAKEYLGKMNFSMVNGDDPINFKFMNEYAVGSFPTLYIIDPSIDNRVLISNTIYGDLNRVRVEFDRYLRIRAKIK